MFKTGFIIFLITEKNLVSLPFCNTLPLLYKKIVINNKIKLINEAYNIFNMNSLRFIMIKLGIIYKEYFLIEKTMASLKGFDLKTAHLLMQYISETSDLDYIVDNRNDNFFIYTIRTALNYIIKLFMKRVENLKNNSNFVKEKKILKTIKFAEYFENFKDFKELIILSKYLDILRKLDNEIYFKRKICTESLNIKIKKLTVKIQDKNNKDDISYYKNQINKGKVSNAQNYVINQIGKKLKHENYFDLVTINKMLVELYCYKILQEDEHLYSLCIKILRNVAYNPNLFFKKIAMKTQIRQLRNFLINHLKHSHFTSQNDSEYLKLMEYIDKNYSNPSFNVEYNHKSLKILLSKEFKKIKIEMNSINKNYKLVANLNTDKTMQGSNNESNLKFSKNIMNNTNPSQNKDEKIVTSSTNNILNSNSLEKINQNVNSNLNSNMSTAINNENLQELSRNKNSKKKSYKEFISDTPILSVNNLKRMDELFDNSKILSCNLNKNLINEIFEKIFYNSEIDDFGMNKKDFKKLPHYLNSDDGYILSHLIHNYFSEHNEKIYMIIQNHNEKVKEKSFDCIVCKKSNFNNQSSEAIFHKHFDSMDHLGYSNISFENLKYFDISNIIRIKFDDFLQRETNIEAIVKFLKFDNISQINSIFYYIIGHYKINFLTILFHDLVSCELFHKFLISEEKISTEYFCLKTKEFYFMKEEMRTIFQFNDKDNENVYIKDIIFTEFIKNGILIDNKDMSSKKTLQNLIFNNLIEIPENVYFTYNSLKHHDKKSIEKFVLEKRYKIKNEFVRSSIIDERMDELILFTDNNHYLLQNFLDFNLLNPKTILYKHQMNLNGWQKIILLSKYNNIDMNIFEISIGNLRILEEKSKNYSDYEYMLIIYGSLMYLKLSNIELENYFKSKQLPQIEEIYKIVKAYELKLIKNIPDLSDGSTIEVKKGNLCQCKDTQNHSYVRGNYLNMDSSTTDESFIFSNNIFTCNNDISVKCLINNYYFKFLNSNNLNEWINRSNNYTIKLDDFENLIESGRVIDAYYYYMEHLKHNHSLKEIETRLYHICLNNLLNYNVFSAVVTFLYFINGNTKELIVQIEAANRIITHELNVYTRSEESFTIEEAMNFVRFKNINFNGDKKYFEINEDTVNKHHKQVILIYKKLVSEFRQFEDDNNTAKENLIFKILKRLEDATLDGNPLLNTPSKEITLESPWHLVFSFCKNHNYEMSLTLLHELGRNNNWITFLYKAQEQECTPQTVHMILEGYFKDLPLKKHLNIIIQSLIDTSINNYEHNLNINEKSSVSELNFNNNINNNNSLNNPSYNSNDFDTTVMGIQSGLLSNRNNSNFNLQSTTMGMNSNYILGKVDFGRNSFNEFSIYSIKPKAKLSQNVNQIYDPIYFMTSMDNQKDKISKYMNILHEALYINWKDLILVSLIFTNADLDNIFTSFTLYLYMTVKEILITKNYIDHKNVKLLKNLREVFDNKKKNLRLIDLEYLIKYLLLNNHTQVLLEVLELFEMPFGFDEFVLFCKSLFCCDFEDAFVHLFIFKNSIFEFFKINFSNNFTGKVWEEEGNVNNINNEFFSQEIKNFGHLTLVFFYKVSNAIINNLIEMFDSSFDQFKLYKLLEILYLTKWNKRYSNYFKNMCVLDCIKSKKIKQSDYKLPFEKIVELLINENNFAILSEYILSYEENKEDDTLLYNIFSTITSFDKNFALYNEEERSQFWDFLEDLLIKANFSCLQIAKFFLFILEIKEDKFYLREQLMIIVKVYKNFSENLKNYSENKLYSNNPNYNIISHNSKNSNTCSHTKKYSNDKFTKFMRNVIGYEIENQINEEDLLEDLKNRILTIIFSNCEFEKLKIYFANTSIIQSGIKYILNASFKLVEELKDESPAIMFSKNSKSFWKRNITNINNPAVSNEHNSLNLSQNRNENNLASINEGDIQINKENSGTLTNFTSLNGINFAGPMTSLVSVSSITMNTTSSTNKNQSSNSGNKTNFNEVVRKACLNLINLNQLQLSLTLSKFYNLSIEELTKFQIFMNFAIDNFNEIKAINKNELKSIYDKACRKVLEKPILLVKSFELEIKEKLVHHVTNCLNHKLIEQIVLYQCLKILICVIINSDLILFKNFDQNIDLILLKLIEANIVEQNDTDLIIYDLNKIIDNDKLLAKTIIGKFFSINFALMDNHVKLFRYVKYFKSPSTLGYAIKTHIQLKNLKSIHYLDSNYWELIFLGYHCFLTDCYHNELANFNDIIKSNIDEKNFFNIVFKLFHICEDEIRVKEIFYCINKILTKGNIISPNSIGNVVIDRNVTDIYGRFKSEIEFHKKSKNFKKLGNIYVRLANDYSVLIKEKNSLSSFKGLKNFQILNKQQELIRLNLFIRAAEVFLMDNCVLNYSKVFNDINVLIKEKFRDDIDIKLE